MSAQQFNGLTPAEHERLAILAEEAGEIVQIAMKIMRHGYEFHHPEHPGQTNRNELEKEIGDLNATVIRMLEAKDLSLAALSRAKDAKEAKLDRWTHHQPNSQTEPTNA